MTQIPAPVNLGSGLSQRDWLRHATRFWPSVLTSSELKVALFVFDRTIMWGKEEEAIRPSHFTEGVWDRKGNCYHGGTGLTTPTVIKAIGSLQTRGLLEVLAVGHTRYYRLNLDLDMPLPTPKRLQLLQKNEGEICRKSQKEGEKNSKEILQNNKEILQNSKEILHPYKKNNKKKGKKQIGHSAVVRPRTLRGAREKGGKDKDKRVERRKESMGVKALTKKDLSRFWRDTVIEWFPDARALPLSVAQESALWQKQKQFNLAGGKDTFTALVDWSLGHWVEIVRGHFSWMDDPPIEPDAWFFIRQFPEWVRFFSKREGPWRDYLQQSHNGGSSFPASQGGEAAEVRRERELLERERAKLAVAASRAVRQGREKPRRKLGGPLTGADVKLEDINGDYDEQA